MLGIIQVLTPDDPNVVGEHGRLIEQQYGIVSKIAIDAVSVAGLFISQLTSPATSRPSSLPRQVISPQSGQQDSEPLKWLFRASMP